MTRRFDTRVIWLSLGLILLGISMPHWFSFEFIGLNIVIKNMEQNPNGNSLLVGAFLLVTLNTIRALPHYLGAFLLGDHIGDRLQKNWIKFILPLAVIPLIYVMINSSIKVNYSFGGPALILLLSIILLQRLKKGRLKPFMKSLVLVQVLFGVEWLDEIPFLTAYGFGHGAISTKIKLWAVQFGYVQSLSLYSLALCTIFLINAVILTSYLVRWSISQDLHHMKLEALEYRASREVLNLVHDLKTPLTSIEGLISLIELRMEDEKNKIYCRNISSSICSMSEMISEILYESRKDWCSVKDLIDYVRAARFSGMNTNIEIELLNKPENVQIWINKIRMTRALINLINNALDAVERKVDGKVTLQLKVHRDQIWLGVSDNGRGMTAEEKKKVWQAGYSTKQHLGIGLSFVKQVAEAHGGTVSIESNIGQGTTIWIHLFRGDNSNENFNY